MMILIFLTVLIVVFLLFVAGRPSSFRVERSIQIRAPKTKVFSLINEFRQWEAWSPWESVDPQVKRSYSGATCDVGAIYEWSGNRNIGQGRMEIIASDPPNHLIIKIDFIAPFTAHNTVEFILTTLGESITLTQAMLGPNTFMGKLMGLFISMDKMIGEKYEQGLHKIKAIAENHSASY